MRTSSRPGKIFAIIIILIVVASGLFTWFYMTELSHNPFNPSFTLLNPVNIAIDGKNNVYILDDKYFRILKMDQTGKHIYSIGVKKEREDLYEYYYNIAADPDGNMYALKLVYFLDDEKTYYEEIARYSPEGRREQVLFRYDHPPELRASASTYESRFLGLQVKGEYLYFDFREEEKITLMRVPLKGGKAENVLEFQAGAYDLYNLAGTEGGRILAASYNGVRLFVIDRQGALNELEMTFTMTEPSGISLADKIKETGTGDFLVTDMVNECIYNVKTDGEIGLFFSKDNAKSDAIRTSHILFKDLAVSTGGTVAVIEQRNNAVFLINSMGKLQAVITGVGYSLFERIFRFAIWVTLGICILSAAAGLLYFYIRVFRRRVALVIKLIIPVLLMIAALLILVTTITFSRVYGKYEQEVYNRLAAYVQAGQKLINGDAVSRLEKPADNESDDYTTICDSLYSLLNQGQDEWNARIYATITRKVDNIFFILADYQQVYGVFYPVTRSPQAYYDIYTTDAAKQEGADKILLTEYTDADGTFIEALGAIRDAKGEITGVLHIGESKDDFRLIHDIFIGDVTRDVLIALGIFIPIFIIVVILIVRSVNLLKNAVNRMSKGEFETEVEIRSHDEIGDLGKGFNLMSHSIRNYITEIKDVSQAYSRFVPRQFLRLLEKKSILDTQLGQQVQMDMTIFFSDIRNFTSLSEQMTPQENFNFLNSYLGCISPIIRRNGGFIDKYVGDGIMALFPGEPDQATETAVAIRKELAVYNSHRQNSGYQPISIGIGINTGKVILGIIGEHERMDSTVISDAVNMASRLEQLTKLYKVNIIIPEQLMKSLPEQKYAIRFLDKVVVKGKTEPVAIYDLFEGDAPDIVELKQKTRTEFEKGVVMYQQHDYRNAYACFREVYSVFRDDQATLLYLARCKKQISG